MKPQELRIGNWINVMGEEIQVIDILCDSVNTHSHENMTFEYIEPIPLTPQRLESFGLKYLQNACWELGNMRIYNLSDETRSMYRITLAGHELVIVNFAHQLQNLYFALTGKELSK